MIKRLLSLLEIRHARKTKKHLASNPPPLDALPEHKRLLLAEHFHLLEDNEPEKARAKLIQFLQMP